MESDHGHEVPPQLEGIEHSDNFDHPLADQAAGPFAYGPFGDAELLGNGRIGGSSVLDKKTQDLPIQLVQINLGIRLGILLFMRKTLLLPVVWYDIRT